MHKRAFLSSLLLPAVAQGFNPWRVTRIRWSSTRPYSQDDTLGAPFRRPVCARLTRSGRGAPLLGKPVLQRAAVHGAAAWRTFSRLGAAAVVRCRLARFSPALARRGSLMWEPFKCGVRRLVLLRRRLRRSSAVFPRFWNAVWHGDLQLRDHETTWPVKLKIDFDRYQAWAKPFLAA